MTRAPQKDRARIQERFVTEFVENHSSYWLLFFFQICRRILSILEINICFSRVSNYGARNAAVEINSNQKKVVVVTSIVLITLDTPNGRLFLLFLRIFTSPWNILKVDPVIDVSLHLQNLERWKTVEGRSWLANQCISIILLVAIRWTDRWFI